MPSNLVKINGRAEQEWRVCDSKIDVVFTILEALGDRMVPVDGVVTSWTAIDSAPYDTAILVTDGRFIVVAERVELLHGGYWWNSYGFFGNDWEWAFDEDSITHWMSLPQPPESKHVDK